MKKLGQVAVLFIYFFLRCFSPPPVTTCSSWVLSRLYSEGLQHHDGSLQSSPNLGDVSDTHMLAVLPQYSAEIECVHGSLAGVGWGGVSVSVPDRQRPRSLSLFRALNEGVKAARQAAVKQRGGRQGKTFKVALWQPV